MKRFIYVFSLLVCLAVNITQAADRLPKGIITTPVTAAPGFTLADMDGNKSSLSSAKGQWAFVHFWASWCGPCRREMPAIQQLVVDMQNKPISIYIINTAEDEDTVFEFLAATAPDLNSLMDRDGLVTEQWQPRGLPATYLVDPGGIIRYQALGGRDWHSPLYQRFLLNLMQQP